MKIKENLKRISFDLGAVIFSILAILWMMPISFFPEEAKVGFFSLILTKFILVSCGLVHFHITRKLMFPYIDFKNEKEWSNNAIVIAMFVLILFSWSRGG